ncbi:STAS-like domain-containing protein [Flavobacterium sp.]|uniref:STAS-like domain-containing protein n=1 Tax=Flavobacterium sp. TaxID=239 RepID=UPI003B9AA337
MKIQDTLVIATEFKDNPGARDREDGPHSGQEFLEDIFITRFNKAIDGNYIILVDLDGVWGYPSSFVSGSFGKLSMEIGSEILLKHLQFKSDRNPLRIEKVLNEIKNPTPKK